MNSLTYGIIAILSVCFALVQGATISVGLSEEFQTISAAVANATSGDIILLNNQLFSGDGNFNVDLSNKSLTIQAAATGSSIIDCDFEGRAFFGIFYEPSTVTFNGITIQNCEASDGGAIHFHDSNNSTDSLDVQFVNCTFSGHRATTHGGALAIGNINGGTTSVTITSSTFFSTYAGNGGAVFVKSVDLIIKNSTFHHSTATSAGGAIHVSSGSLSLDSSSLHHNDAYPGYGGAVYLGPGSTSSSVDSSFYYNSANANYGGAWFIDHFSSASFESSSFENNTADHAGAICVKYNANLTSTSSSFTNNSANVYGGAIHAYQAKSLYFDQTTITRNLAYGGAAAYIVLVESVVFNSSTVTDNQASDYGNVMYCQDSDIDFAFDSVSGNGDEDYECGPDCSADGEGIQYCPRVADCSAEEKRRHDVTIVLIVFALLVAMGITYFVYYFIGQLQEQQGYQKPVEHAAHQQL